MTFLRCNGHYFALIGRIRQLLWLITWLISHKLDFLKRNVIKYTIAARAVLFAVAELLVVNSVYQAFTSVVRCTLSA